MPRRDAWVIGVAVALAALAVLASGGTPPAATSGVRPSVVSGFPLCPGVAQTRQVAAVERDVAQAVAVAYVGALQEENADRAAGLADTAAMDATTALARMGLPGPDDVKPSAGRAAPLAHDPLGRAIAGRCGVEVLAATIAVDVRLGDELPTLTVLLIRRPDRFLVFNLR